MVIFNPVRSNKHAFKIYFVNSWPVDELDIPWMGDQHICSPAS